MTSAAHDCRLPGPSLGDRSAPADDVLAALLQPGELRQDLLVGGVSVADQDASEE
jgi:hypothetical protein